jgi:cytochrome bd-type quinol oxidase subunit 2
MKKFQPITCIIAGLWAGAALVFLLVSTYVESTGNYLTELQSGIVMLISFTMVIAAMIIQTWKNRKKHANWAFFVKICFLVLYYLAGAYSMVIIRR